MAKAALKKTASKEPSEPKPVVVLSSGVDGNAFAILSACTRAARKAGWTPAKIETFKEEAKAGDYDHVLSTCEKYFDVA